MLRRKSLEDSRSDGAACRRIDKIGTEGLTRATAKHLLTDGPAEIAEAVIGSSMIMN